MGIPKGARKLVIGEETWRWKVGGWFINIWSPEEEFFKVYHEEFGLGWDDYYGVQGTVYPGDIRKYIENNLIDGPPPETKVDPTAIPGKLYVYRPKKTSQGPNIELIGIQGGSHGAGFLRNRAILDLLDNKHPLFLVNCRKDKKEDAVLYKVLVGDMMCTFKIKSPRTWRGSFVEHDPTFEPTE